MPEVRPESRAPGTLTDDYEVVDFVYDYGSAFYSFDAGCWDRGWCFSLPGIGNQGTM